MVSLHDVQQAQARIAGTILRTPLLPFFGAGGEGIIWLKPENLQPIGSFKIRGAANRILALTPEELQRGVIAYSSGNHAQGVAFAAQRLGIKAVIVMPTNAPRVKVEATRRYGAEVVLYDPAREKREDVAARLLEEQPYVLVPPFNDPYIIAGQGTVGLEIFEDLPSVDLVVVPVGGGGLISGTALALKALKPNVSIIGVEPELAADAQAGFRSGQIVELSAAETNRTLADGVRTLRLGDLTFAHIRQYVDDIVTVTEAEIRHVTKLLLMQTHLVVEPTAALALAALLHHRAELPAFQSAVAVLSGGNIDPELLTELLSEPAAAASLA
ncbi:threonine ammonia-lyase [Hymenobacter weizhouensis]|uniref:threonine ammonia-lyase n=1 Tax=Hymenobacter sp. YIM 151500-1 TaxID=2987689 RepID=UPI00222721DC|nr:threonine/serine dehydratase [Hymenobacter sp. YIM 151500-1]UYZ62748.1 threonine/serine dehydratase [Hymenobacter sp. YIM 151500-1]